LSDHAQMPLPARGPAALLLGPLLPLYLHNPSLEVLIPQGHHPQNGPGVVLHEVADRVRPHRDLVHRESLFESAPPGSGRGVARLLSRLESLICLQLLQAGILEPRHKVTVRDLTGKRLAMTDLCRPKDQTFGDYEGDHHCSSRAKFWSNITNLETFTDGGGPDWAPARMTCSRG